MTRQTTRMFTAAVVFAATSMFSLVVPANAQATDAMSQSPEVDPHVRAHDANPESPHEPVAADDR